MRKPDPELVAIPLQIAIEAICAIMIFGGFAAILIIIATPYPVPV